jgi:hypothetical protein
LEEILSKNASLWKAITALANLKVDPPKVVFIDEFCQNVSNFNSNLFGVWHWTIKVEILEVNGAELCAWARKHAVDKKLGQFEGCSVGSHVTQEADAIAANCYAGAIRIIFFWPYFTYHHGVADFLSFMARYVMVVDKEEGISARSPFCVGRRPRAYALA